MASLSNDPLGEFNPKLTEDINYKSTVKLASIAKDIGVNRFVFVSTQSLYGISKVNEELMNVFLPTTPNPTSGFLLMVPKKELIYLDVSFEQASKFIVSAGTSNIS